MRFCTVGLIVTLALGMLSAPRKATSALHDAVGRRNSLVSSLSLAVLLVAVLLFAPSAEGEPLAVTIAQLVGSPDQYSGKEVAFDGVLVRMSNFTTYEKSSASPSRGQRIQLVLADMTGAQILVITYVPSYDFPTLGMVGKAGTAYSVRGTFFHIPVEPGPPLQLVAVPGKDGLKRK